jgi:hypothetical protein
MAAKVKGFQWFVFSLIGVSFFGVILISFFSSGGEPRSPDGLRHKQTAVVGRNALPTIIQPTRTSEPTQTPKPSPINTPTESPSPTAYFLTATPDSDGNIYHIVGASDTLHTISKLYGISDEELRTMNWMHGNAVFPGQKLLMVRGKNWQPQHPGYAVQKGEMLSAYPLSVEQGRFTFHYMPQTYPAVDPAAVAKLFENGLINDERLFGRRLNSHFDVFGTGLFYEIPNQYLRGHSYSKDLYIAFLHDGSGDAVDQQYLAAHEMTHLYMWNTFGQPMSFLLSEGAAVYAGKSLIASSDTIQLEQFCKAYEMSGKLPKISDEDLSYKGQNYDLENYYAAGCFVKYLIEIYGVEKLGTVYASDQYIDVYGKSLQDLEIEWHTALHNLNIPVPFDPQELIDLNAQLKAGYLRFFADIFTRPDMIRPYMLLDQARLAELELRFADAKELLSQFNDAIQ